MSPKRALCIVLLLLLAPVGQGWAEQKWPETVSPGARDQFLPVASGCPTFSWAAPSGAVSLELVVYKVPSEFAGSSGAPVDGQMEGSAEEPRLRVSLPGGATAWTPATTWCLAPDHRYAWLIRALDVEGAEVWSEASFFQVAGDGVAGAMRGSTAGEVRPPQATASQAPAEEPKGPGPRARTFLEKARLLEPTLGVGGGPELLVALSELTGESANAVMNVDAEGDPNRTHAYRGEISHSAARAVEGVASSLVGTTYGVSGISTSTLGRGVRGIATSNSGSTRGVIGGVFSPDGYGGYFENAAGNLEPPPPMARDLVIGGKIGLITSDPAFPTSALMLDAAGAVDLVAGSTLKLNAKDGVVVEAKDAKGVGSTVELTSGEKTVKLNAEGGVVVSGQTGLIKSDVNSELKLEAAKAIRLQSGTDGVVVGAGLIRSGDAETLKLEATGAAISLVADKIELNSQGVAVKGAVNVTGKVTAESLEGTLPANSVDSVNIKEKAVTGEKINLGDQKKGDIIFYNGTTWTRLAAGTPGSLLTTQGTTKNPAWTDSLKVEESNVSGEIKSADGSGTEAGKSLLLTAGAEGGNGGGDGGKITISGGGAVTTGKGGDVTISAGTGGTMGAGGDILLTPGGQGNIILSDLPPKAMKAFQVLIEEKTNRLVKGAEVTYGLGSSVVPTEDPGSTEVRAAEETRFLPGLVVDDERARAEAARYDPLAPMLLAELRKQNRRLEAQEELIRVLMARLERLESGEALVARVSEGPPDRIAQPAELRSQSADLAFATSQGSPR